jgi:hypothetical protein
MVNLLARRLRRPEHEIAPRSPTRIPIDTEGGLPTGYLSACAFLELGRNSLLIARLQGNFAFFAHQEDGIKRQQAQFLEEDDSVLGRRDQGTAVELQASAGSQLGNKSLRPLLSKMHAD